MFCCEPIFGGRVGSINRWDGSLEHQWGSHDMVAPSTTPQKKRSWSKWIQMVHVETELAENS